MFQRLFALAAWAAIMSCLTLAAIGALTSALDPDGSFLVQLIQMVVVAMLGAAVTFAVPAFMNLKRCAEESQSISSPQPVRRTGRRTPVAAPRRARPQRIEMPAPVFLPQIYAE